PLSRRPRGGSLADDRPYPVALAQERAGAGDHHVAFVEAFANFRIAPREQPDADATRLHPFVAHDLNNRAFRTVENRGQRDRGAAASADFDDRAGIGADLDLVVA